MIYNIRADSPWIGPIQVESGPGLKIEDPWKKFSRDLQSSIFNPVLDSSWTGPIQGESAPPAHTTSHPESQARVTSTFITDNEAESFLYGVRIAHGTVSRFPIFLQGPTILVLMEPEPQNKKKGKSVPLGKFGLYS